MSDLKIDVFVKKLRWLIQCPPEDPVRWEITPAMAKEMFSYNERNRSLTESIARDYARAMAESRWSYTGDTIKFSDHGRLIDGQKRLWACIYAGRSFVTAVAFGVPDPAFADIDNGQTRTTAHIFDINGVKNHAMMAAATKWVAGYEAGRMATASQGNLKLSHAQLYECYLLHDRLPDSAWVGHAFTKNRLASPSMMVAVHYLCARKGRERADRFFEKLGDGLGFDNKKDPAYKLYQTLIANAGSQEKLGRKAIAAITIKAWNASRLGRSPAAFQFSPDEPFPRII